MSDPFNMLISYRLQLFSLIGEEAPRKWMTTSSLKALFKKGKEVRWKPA